MEIRIENLTKKFGDKIALDKVSFNVGQGMFGLLGKNGAGKTTLMRLIATLLNKSEGTISVCNIPVERAGEVRKMIGYLPQDFSIYPNMRVYDALDYLGVLSGMEKYERKAAVNKVLEQVNLGSCRRLKVKTLSGGMKRRLGIAQAILHNPKVLIVDEPTAGLDPQERIRFRNLLCEIAQDRIVLLSTHIVEDIQSTCDSIAVLDQGKLLYQGSVQKLIQTARNHVFQVKVPKQQFEELKNSYTVTGMVTLDNEVNVRFLAVTEPYPGSVMCEPTMEEAYMLYLLMNGSESNHTDMRDLIGGDMYVS